MSKKITVTEFKETEVPVENKPTDEPIGKNQEATELPPDPNDDPEQIWDAFKARHIADSYESRKLKLGLQDVMQYVKSAAYSGKHECTVYRDNIYNNVDFKLLIVNLEKRGYTVTKSSQYNDWSIRISW